jgi:hypothetical protein
MEKRGNDKLQTCTTDESCQSSSLHKISNKSLPSSSSLTGLKPSPKQQRKLNLNSETVKDHMCCVR